MHYAELLYTHMSSYCLSRAGIVAKQYNNTIQNICNAYNVCQLSESQARAVIGGTWQG